MSKKFHTELDGASWPTVASSHQRLKWIAAILEDENIKAQPTQISLAYALLDWIAKSDIEDDSFRIVAFKACLVLQKIDLEKGE